MSNINPYYNDCYFSKDGGLEEAEWVFVEGNNIKRFSAADNIHVGETGFGTGLNFFALVDYISRQFSDYSGTLEYYSCEKHPLLPLRTKELLLPFFTGNINRLNQYMDLYKRIYKDLQPGLCSIYTEIFNIKVKLLYFYGDVLEAFKFMDKKRDIWFLDGHDPEKNPDMWSSELFMLMADKSKHGTTLASYTSKGVVKKGLRNAGFFIKRKKGFGRKRHMITGVFGKNTI